MSLIALCSSNSFASLKEARVGESGHSLQPGNTKSQCRKERVQQRDNTDKNHVKNQLHREDERRYSTRQWVQEDEQAREPQDSNSSSNSGKNFHDDESKNRAHSNQLTLLLVLGVEVLIDVYETLFGR